MDRIELTDRDIRLGVWVYGDLDTEHGNPQTVDEMVPSDILERDRLWIWISTISDLSEKERKAAKKAWLAILPTLTNIRFLWVSGLVNQEFFDTICQMRWLEALNLKWTSVRSLKNIANLPHLVHLAIGSSSKLEDIEALSQLRGLQTLRAEGWNKIDDITLITTLTQLQGLHFISDIHKKHHIASIAGLENLRKLRYLSLDGVEVRQKDISPLLHLQHLENLEIGFWWRKSDLQQLYNALPALRYGSVKEAGDSDDYDRYLRPSR